MRLLRVALWVMGTVTFIATMAGQIVEAKILAGVIGGALTGLLWALLFYYSPLLESAYWNELSKNTTEAQRLIDQNPNWISWRKWHGLPPKSNNSSLDMLGTLKSPVCIGLLFMLSVMFSTDQNFTGYVLDIKQPLPPEPKTLLLYLGFLFCLSLAFTGIFMRPIEWFLPHKKA